MSSFPQALHIASPATNEKSYWQDWQALPNLDHYIFHPEYAQVTLDTALSNVSARSAFSSHDYRKLSHPQETKHLPIDFAVCFNCHPSLYKGNLEVDTFKGVTTCLIITHTKAIWALFPFPKNLCRATCITCVILFLLGRLHTVGCWNSKCTRPKVTVVIVFFLGCQWFE